MKIAHISDIHIRLASRHEEYKKVFDTLIKKLKDQKPDLIVNTGDTFHSKVHLSPEAFDSAKYLYDRLVEIAPNVIIAGNHDMNVSGTHRLDAVTPFVDLFNSDKDKKKQITYLEGSGVFDYNDEIRFFLYPIVGNDNPDIKKATNDKINIGLYHGIVGGAKTDTHWTFKKEDQKVDIPYDELDAVLLGDIHRYQMLKDNMGYASSLIQQNWGENPNGHGFIIWEFDNSVVKNKYVMSKFIPVENSKGFYRLVYEGGQITSDYDYIPSQATVKVIYDNDVIREDVEREINSKYNVNNIILEEKGIDVDGQTIDVKEDIMNLHNYENQKEVVSDYFDGDEHKEEILKLNEELFEQNKNKFHTDSKRLLWKPQYIEFDNIFVYGENNKFIFSNKYGIIGLFSPNRSGKSSFLDTIQFAVYGETAHTSTYDDIINKESKDYKTFITLKVENKTFSIERTGKRTGSGWNNSINVIEYDTNGDVLSEEGDMREAKSIIEKYFGTAKNYEKTSYIYQDNTERFLNLTPAKRKDWLYDNLGLQVFEVLHESAKKQSKDMRNDIDYLENKDIKKTIDNNVITMSDYDNRIDSLDQKMEKVDREISKYDDKISELKENKKPEDNSLEDKSDEIDMRENNINVIKKDILKLKDITKDEIHSEIFDGEKVIDIEKKISDLKKSKDKELPEEITKKNKLKEVLKDGKDLKDQIESKKKAMEEITSKYEDSPVDGDELSEEIKDLTEEAQKLQKYQFMFENIEDEISQCRDEASVLNKDDRFTTEELCQTCPLLESAFEKKNKLPELEKDLKECVENIERYEKLSEKITHLTSILGEYKNDQADYNNLRSEKKGLEQRREDKLSQYSSLQEDIKVLKGQREEIINSKIETLEGEKKSVIKENEDKVEKRFSEIKSDIERKQHSLEIEQNKLKDLQKEQKRYEKNLENISYNNSIEEEISVLKIEQDTKVKEKKEYQDKLIDLKSEKKSIQNRIDDLKDEYEKLKKLKSDYVVFEKYITATHKNKIPLQVISNMLKVVQHEVNMVLNQITNFKLKLFVDNENVVCNIIDERNEREANRLSGMERFTSNLAFRIAISQIGNMPVSNILIVDEGFSAVDATSSQELPELFRYLKTKFDHIFVVSHHESMRDIVDYNVEIDTSKVKSKIYEE